MSRTKKHRDLFFLQFLYRLIKSIGNKYTDRRTFRWEKVRRKVSCQYGGNNWADKHGVDAKDNRAPYKRAKKRTDRREALQQAHWEIDENNLLENKRSDYED